MPNINRLREKFKILFHSWTITEFDCKCWILPFFLLRSFLSSNICCSSSVGSQGSCQGAVSTTWGNASWLDYYNQSVLYFPLEKPCWFNFRTNTNTHETIILLTTFIPFQWGLALILSQMPTLPVLSASVLYPVRPSSQVLLDIILKQRYKWTITNNK